MVWVIFFGIYALILIFLNRQVSRKSFRSNSAARSFYSSLVNYFILFGAPWYAVIVAGTYWGFTNPDELSKESCPVRPIPAYKAGLYGLTENRQLSNSNPKPPFIPVHRTGHSGCFSKYKLSMGDDRGIWLVVGIGISVALSYAVTYQYAYWKGNDEGRHEQAVVDGTDKFEK